MSVETPNINLQSNQPPLSEPHAEMPLEIEPVPPNFGIRNAMLGVVRWVHGRLSKPSAETMPSDTEVSKPTEVELVSSTTDAWELEPINPSLMEKAKALLSTPESDVQNPQVPRAKQTLFAPQSEILNGRIELIDSRDTELIETYLRLDDGSYARTIEALTAKKEATKGTLGFTDKGGEKVWTGGLVYAANVFSVAPGITVRMATGEAYNPFDDSLDSEKYRQARSMIGLVRIEIDASMHAKTDKQLAYTVENTLKEMSLNHLLQPTEKDTDEYKARVAADYRDVPVHSITETSGLVIGEDSTHFTVEQPGLHKQLENLAERIQIPYHTAWLDRVAKVIKNGGLMSTMERFKRGIGRSGGRSTHQDILTGGADWVYSYKQSGKARTFTGGDGNMHMHDLVTTAAGSAQLVYASRVLDRIDAKCFTGDTYGALELNELNRQLPPEDFFKPGGSGGIHELDFDTFLDNKDLIAIVCHDTQRDKLIGQLRDAGITEINGKAVEVFITESINTDSYDTLRSA